MNLHYPSQPTCYSNPHFHGNDMTGVCPCHWTALMPAVLCVGSYAGKTNSWLVMLAETLRAGKAKLYQKRSVPI